MADSSSRGGGGQAFTSMVSCKWLVLIGVLTVAISLVAGILLGVIAVHFSNATVRSMASTATTGDMGSGAIAGAQEMASTTTMPSSTIFVTNKQDIRDVSGATPEESSTSILPTSPTIKTDAPSTPTSTPTTLAITSPTTTTTPIITTSPTTPTTLSTTTKPTTLSSTSTTTTSTTTTTTSRPATNSTTAATNTSTFASTLAINVTTTLSPNVTTEEALEGRDLHRETTTTTMSTATTIESGTTTQSSTTRLVSERTTTAPSAMSTSFVPVLPEELFGSRPEWLISTNSATSTTTATPALPTTSNPSTAQNRMFPPSTTPAEDDDSESVDLPESPPVQCPGSPDRVIRQDQFCDSIVDCPRAADEIGCSCRSRLSSNKICDGVFDCPSLEDELGCRGCNESQFTCDVTRSRALCIPLRQRCDGIEQCPDGFDEIGCSVLSPTQKLSEITVPKYSSGYAMRNVNNKWYPLCAPEAKHVANATAHAFRICWTTVGNTTGTIAFTSKRIEASGYSGKYAAFNEVEGRPFTVVNSCPTSSLLFVQCPPPQCGKKAPGNLPETIIKLSSSALTSSMTRVLVKRSSLSYRVRYRLETYSQSLSGESESRSSLNGQRLSDRPTGSRRKRQEAMGRIVGGRNSGQGAWPWMVAIMREGDYLCGGSLLSSTWVVSAAHCFHSYHVYYYEVQLGMLRRSSFSPLEQTLPVIGIFLHPGYDNRKLKDDIALVLVKEPFQLNQWAAPICLPPPKYLPTDGTNCTVIGWGNTAESGPDSDSLREVVVPVTPCKGTEELDGNSIICAGYPEGKKDACRGDSGGPLVCPNPSMPGRWTVLGIVSFGIGCARPDSPGVYTRVAHYLDWIHNTTLEQAVLPSMVPRSKCPGMVCQRGAGECLRSQFVCDNIVDCLEADDEANCFLPSVNLTTQVPDSIEATLVTTAAPLMTPPESVVTTLEPISAQVLPSTSRPSVCTGEEFTCSEIFQCINKDRVCDRFKDCQDGSDELSCTCADYLKQSNQSHLICDDHLDCQDLSDEIGCRNCPEGESYSYVSSRCIPDAFICDGTNQTASAEEESNCVTLVPANGIIELGHTGKPPERLSSGLVAVNTHNVWEAAAVHRWTSSITDELCSYMGFGPGLSFKFVNRTTVNFQVLKPKDGFIWHSKGQQRATDEESKSLFPNGGTPAQPWTRMDSSTLDVAGAASKTPEWYVNIRCASQSCGTRPNLMAKADVVPNIEGRYPWHASLFSNGSFLCGATLISPQWILASPNCTNKINLTSDYVAVLLGARRFIQSAQPREQIIRIVKMVSVGAAKDVAAATLLQMQRPVELTEFVNPVCLASRSLIRSLIKKNQCVAVGRNGTLLASSTSLTSFKMPDARHLQAIWANNETFACPSPTWSGSVICSDGNSWSLVALFDRPCPNSARGAFNDTLDGLWPFFDQIINVSACSASQVVSNPCKDLSDVIPAPECSTIRCPLGECLAADQVCDGIPHCRDSRDEEPNMCELWKRPKAQESSHHHRPGPSRTSCTEDEFQCGTKGRCIPRENTCDGFADCPDGLDEKIDCPATNKSNFHCLAPSETRNRQVIPRSAVCDGVNDCSNEMDESLCMWITAKLPMALDDAGNPLEPAASEGFLMARKDGRWFTYCSLNWDDKDETHANAICSFFDYHQTSGVVMTKVPSAQLFKSVTDCPSVIHLKCS